MTFRSGDIVLVPFPFTDLAASKRRPALLLNSLGEFGDWLCLPVTSQGRHVDGVVLADGDFIREGLPRTSWVRTNRPTVIAETVMLGRIASIDTRPLAAIRWRMCNGLGCVATLASEASPAAYSAEGNVVR